MSFLLHQAPGKCRARMAARGGSGLEKKMVSAWALRKCHSA
jgi:hypothetical protein